MHEHKSRPWQRSLPISIDARLDRWKRDRTTHATRMHHKFIAPPSAFSIFSISRSPDSFVSEHVVFSARPNCLAHPSLDTAGATLLRDARLPDLVFRCALSCACQPMSNTVSRGGISGWQPHAQHRARMFSPLLRFRLCIAIFSPYSIPLPHATLIQRLPLRSLRTRQRAHHICVCKLNPELDPARKAQGRVRSTPAPGQAPSSANERSSRRLLCSMRSIPGRSSCASLTQSDVRPGSRTTYTDARACLRLPAVGRPSPTRPAPPPADDSHTHSQIA
ncbi:hypothetical protein L227DRAFT_268839 [Lentinus tigrinus ALCF2SS1-6]|uniref:Uncharacterized protein n=1 Tax=Lentinus tigrinus ALCF2SS1-6 TaxID=1328759 RepID=A0A5C2SLT9_9APHY|nr:hypothetical protein L227DRAFT_268839 [Lentinus tigrinus ALCF2SS1-6]